MRFGRSSALAGVVVLAAQLLGATPALASAGTSECDFSGDSLEITLGAQNVGLTMYGTQLECDDGGLHYLSIASLRTISVSMADEAESDGELTIWLEDSARGGGWRADWPRFDAFDIDVTTEVHLKGTFVTGSGQGLSIRIGARTLAFSGTTATSTAPSYEILGSTSRDTIDASGYAGRVSIEAKGGNDLIRGGSGRDYLRGDGGDDLLYGGAGDDRFVCELADEDVAWGQAGDDYFDECFLAGPGGGDDEVNAATRATYADLSEGIEWEVDSCDVTTGGAAGSDLFTAFDEDRIYGSQGDDLIVDDCGNSAYGLGGDDLIRVIGLESYGGDGDDTITSLGSGHDEFSGGAGDDVLRGRNGDDVLVGGSGRDSLFAGSGRDNCRGGEILRSCERVIVG